MIVIRLLVVLIEYPVLALVPAGIFYFLFVESDKGFILAVAILWLVYLVYECAMKYRVLCSGDCDIRVDLLFLYPLLLVLSVAAIVVFLVHKSRPR